MTTTRPLLMSAAAAATLGLWACAGCDSPEPFVDRAPGEWQLTWSDDFDGPAGQAPDATRWKHDVGGDGWGNDQLEYDSDRVENAALDGQGNLVITARKEDLGGRSYTSARLLTKDLFAQTHGRFEARIQLPLGAGLWPAFWLLGADLETVPWPGCGEIDIMEYRGQVPDLVHGSLHGPGYSGANPVTDTFFLPDGQRFSDDFHVFAIEWDRGRIAWFVDGALYQVATGAQLPSGASWVFEHPFFIILNLAVGGNFVGSPDATTVFPAAMRVDYVRVYERAP
ncbi:MAG: glycoside hydrolase family 16 protein [Myxococcota bacterium]